MAAIAPLFSRTSRALTLGEFSFQLDVVYHNTTLLSIQPKCGVVSSKKPPFWAVFCLREHSLFCSVLVSAFPDSLMHFRYRINRYGLDRDPQHRLDKMIASEEVQLSASN